MVKNYRELIQQKCNEPANRFGPAFFERHILLVERFALQLAGSLGADRDILLAAVYLHDLAAVLDFSCLAAHAERGAELAGEILERDGHGPDWIERVQGAIRTHSAPLGLSEGTAEQVCLSNADGLAQMADPVYWLFYIFSVRGFDYAAGRKWYSERVDSVKSRLIPQARKLAAPFYELDLELLRER
ncbi:HD domain-containing protein [bacterium]|nr:HD domain-containing protein [bacterium]